MSVNMKSTKQEIMDAYNEVKAKLDAINSVKDDPAEIVKENHNKEVIQSANEISVQGILAPEIVDKYKSLCEAIKMKSAQLRDMYGIEAEANSLVALINAHKDKEVELKAKYSDMEASLKESFEVTKNSLSNELSELENKKDEILKQTRKDNADLYASLESERKREEEQYEYDLKRKRKIANDKWEDEKAEREKELSLRESDLAERIAAVEKREEKMEDLQSTVDNIPTLIENARADGKKEGKAEADKSHVFEVRSINTKNEYEQKALQDQIDRLTNDLSLVRTANAELQMKLDMAYSQMKDLAADTVKSNGSIKIIGSDNTNKAVSK
jgi:hypothetical protein